jgi:translocation and assembly module TamB
MAGFFSLVLLIMLFIFYLLSTESGTRFLVTMAEEQLDGQLRVGAVNGTVLNRLELINIRFDSSIGNTQVGRLVLDWNPTKLLHLHLHILEFSASDISYISLSHTQEPDFEDSVPFLLPEITLPVTITLEELRLQHIVFIAAPNTDPFQVESVLLGLHWDSSGINLQKLAVAMPEGTLQGQGMLNPVGQYPLQLQTVVKTRDTDLPSLKLAGVYSGDLQELAIRQIISGDIGAEFNGTLKQVIQALSWQGDLKISELYPATFSPEIPGRLTGKIHTEGNLQQAAVNGNLSMRHPDAVEVNWDANLNIQINLENLSVELRQLLLTHVDSQAEINVQGTLDEEQNLDMVLHWQQLQWPLSGEPEYSSIKGAVQLKGPVNAYRLTLNAEAAGTQMPTAKVQLDAEGNTENIDISQLTINSMDGVIGMQGKVQWSPRVKWQLTNEGKRINPGVHYKEWPGQFDWSLQTRGELTRQGTIASITLSHFQGTLRDLPVSGIGDVQLTPQDITIKGVQLSSGSAVFSALGSLGDASKITWKANVADFSDLLPDGGGTLNAQGTVQGEMTEPQVTAHLSAGSLVLPGIEVEQLQTDIAFDLSWKDPFNLQLKAKGVQVADNLVKSVSVQADGTREAHSATLSASHELADIFLSLTGGYQQEQWQGRVDSFTLAGADFGSWQLESPAEIIAGATAAKVEKLCLQRESADLCIDGFWDVENIKTRGDVQIAGFPLSWLSPWFPDSLQSMDGVFSLKAAASMLDTWKADVDAEITAGSINYVTDTRTGSLPHEGARVNLHIADNDLDADFQLSVDSNIISGKLISPGLLDTRERTSIPLDGELFIDAKHFDIVELMVPEVKNLDAAIDARFKVQGTLEKPDVRGEGKLNIAYVLVPLAGLELKDTVLNILADNKELTLHGKLNSPDGYLDLAGKAVLDEEQNWPVHLTLKGNNFRLINLPEMQAYVSSDLTLERNNDLLSLSGELSIPKADVLLRALPQGTETVSPDVVIVQEMEEKEEIQRSPLQMNLKVSLGKGVHFAGMGLNTFIDGQLVMTAEPGEQMLGSGEFRIKQGTFRAYGQDLDIQTGVISFPGGPLSKPGVNLRATRTIGDVVVGVNAIGPASKPRLTTFSTPPMSESNIISYLLTGSSPQEMGTGAMLSVGRQINNKLSVSVGTDVKTGDSEFITRYRLNRKIYVQATTATNSNAADIFYTTEFGATEDQVEEAK